MIPGLPQRSTRAVTTCAKKFPSCWRSRRSPGRFNTLRVTKTTMQITPLSTHGGKRMSLLTQERKTLSPFGELKAPPHRTSPNCLGRVYRIRTNAHLQRLQKPPGAPLGSAPDALLDTPPQNVHPSPRHGPLGRCPTHIPKGKPSSGTLPGQTHGAHQCDRY